MDANGGESDLKISDKLIGLLDIIMNTFVPLMKQNEAAYEQYIAQGETLFNEEALRQDKALFEGELMGHPFKTVTKSFTVQVWRDIKESWGSLSDKQRGDLSARVSGLAELAGESDKVVKLSA